MENLQVIAVLHKVWSRLDKSESINTGKKRGISLHNVKRLNDAARTGLKSSSSTGLAGTECLDGFELSVFFS